MQALEVSKKRYEGNKILYKDLYGFDFGEKSVFDIIIDTDLLDAAGVIKKVQEEVQKFL